MLVDVKANIDSPSSQLLYPKSLAQAIVNAWPPSEPEPSLFREQHALLEERKVANRRA
jgi:hypothetical protein